MRVVSGSSIDAGHRGGPGQRLASCSRPACRFEVGELQVVSLLIRSTQAGGSLAKRLLLLHVLSKKARGSVFDEERHTQ